MKKWIGPAIRVGLYLLHAFITAYVKVRERQKGREEQAAAQAKAGLDAEKRMGEADRADSRDELIDRLHKKGL